MIAVRWGRKESVERLVRIWSGRLVVIGPGLGLVIASPRAALRQ